MNLLRPLAPIALAIALLALTSGCGSTSDSATATVTVTAKPAVATPLALTSGGYGDQCFTAPPRDDYLWADVQWKANVGLRSFRFHLTNAHGVTQIGQPVTLAPRNFGGRIDFGGATWWKDRKSVFDDGALRPAQDGSTTADFYTPGSGETGLLAFRLRFDKSALATTRGATWDGVTATYVTETGQTGTVQVSDTDATWDRAHCQDRHLN